MSPSPRPATEADLDALTAVAFEAKAHWGYPPEWLELWRDELTYTAATLRECDVFCVERGGAFAGVVSIGPGEAPDEVEIEGLWVRPSRMGEGLGRALMEVAIAAARRRGAVRIRIASDPGAEPFYRKLGARPAGRVPSRPEGRELPLLVLDVL